MKNAINPRKALIACAAGLCLVVVFALAACSPNSQTQTEENQPQAAAPTEGACAWTVGYEVNSDGMVQIADGTLLAVHDYCLTCHNDGDESNGEDWESVIEATADWKGETGVNPHESHLGVMQCDMCHLDGHAQVMYCNNCHFMEL